MGLTRIFIHGFYQEIAMKKNEIMAGIGLIAILSTSCLLFLSSVAAQPGSDTDTSQMQLRVQGFFDTITAQSISPDAFQNAYQRMFPGPLSQDIQDMILKTEEIMKGTRWTSEFLDRKNVGKDMILMRYLCKSETHPVIWYFTFYRSQTSTTPGTWNCLGIRFDTDYDSLFRESLPPK
jgi:hypothetical protein